MDLYEIKQQLPKFYSAHDQKRLQFHNLQRNAEVVKATELLLAMQKVRNEKAEMVLTAALFLHVGYRQDHAHPQKAAVAYLKKMLPRYQYSHRQVLLISGMVLASGFPASPQNELEQIICDANSAFLGEPAYFEKSKLLKAELQAHHKILSDDAWQQYQLRIFQKHQYFTASAQKLWEKQKMKNLQKLKLVTA